MEWVTRLTMRMVGNSSSWAMSKIRLIGLVLALGSSSRDRDKQRNGCNSAAEACPERVGALCETGVAHVESWQSLPS